MMVSLVIQHLHTDCVILFVEVSSFDQIVDKVDYPILVEYLMVVVA